MSALVLDSTFGPRSKRQGTVRLRLVNAGRETFTGFRLAFSSFVPLTPPADSAARLVRRIGTLHEIVPPDGLALESGTVWDIGPLDCAYPLVHANDGPVRAYLIASDDATVPVRAVPTERAATVRVARDAPPALALASRSDVTEGTWAVAAGCEQRLYPDDATVLGRDRGTPVTAGIDETLGAESFRLSADEGSVTAVAGSPVALQWALMALARRRRGDSGPGASDFRPRYGFRGLMVDLSRHFYPAVDVEEMIDMAAWRRLNRLHLHLTDDQAWRLPVEAYPALAEVGAWRGHGLPIPPQNGSGPEPYGGCYTVDDIRRWVARAGELGIELIPEVDVPGHSYAAIAAVPELLDPHDASRVESVHHFSRNVLNPGLAATWPFLEAAFGAVADLFPSRWLHIGGDEVPEGAWQTSAAAERYAAGRGLAGHKEIEAAFVAEIIEVATRTTGRRIGAWQEAADHGGLRPGDGYVVAWRSIADAERLASAGYEVVSSPGSTYYLDMATGADWHLPGMSWAGFVTDDTITDFDPTQGLAAGTRDRLAGVQACLWGEHAPDRATWRALLLPRLDAFGDAAWTTA